MKKTINRIRSDIEIEKNKNSGRIMTPAVRRVCKKHFTELNNLPKSDMFAICEGLLDTNEWESRMVAFEFAFRIKRYTQDDCSVLFRWLTNHVHGWDSCDDLCTHAFGLYLFQYPSYIEEVKNWTGCQNQWIRRAAAVVTIYSIRRQRLLGDALEISDLLLTDDEDLVCKGYGWMLKEVSIHEPQMIYDYVLHRKHKMPRVALRYAIERLSPEFRAIAMLRQQDKRRLTCHSSRLSFASTRSLAHVP